LVAFGGLVALVVAYRKHAVRRAGTRSRRGRSRSVRTRNCLLSGSAKPPSNWGQTRPRSGWRGCMRWPAWRMTGNRAGRCASTCCAPICGCPTPHPPNPTAMDPGTVMPRRMGSMSRRSGHDWRNARCGTPSSASSPNTSAKTPRSHGRGMISTSRSRLRRRGFLRKPRPLHPCVPLQRPRQLQGGEFLRRHRRPLPGNCLQRCADL